MVSLPDAPEQRVGAREAYGRLLGTLHAYRRAGLLRLTGKISLRAVAVFAVAASLTITLERMLGLPGPAQRILTLATLLAPLVGLGALLRRSYGCWRVSFWVRELTRALPDLGWKLRVGMGLWPLRAGGRTLYSQTLIDAALVQAAAASKHVPPAPKVRILPRWKWGFLLLLLGALGPTLCYPRASAEAALRVLHANGLPRLSLFPKTQWVARGSVALFTASVDPPAGTPPVAEVSTDSLVWAESARPRRSTSVGLFDLSIGPVDSSTLVRVRQGHIVSAAARVLVKPKPDVLGIQLRVHYPAYTGVGTVVVPQELRDVRALRGSTLEIVATLSTPVLDARLVRAEGDTLRMMVEGTSAVARVAVATNDLFRMNLCDSLGQRAEYPCCSLHVVDDEPPSISIAEPGRNMQLDETMVLPLTVEAEDDFGFSRASLKWSRPAASGETSLLEIPRRAPLLRLHHVWDLGGLNLLPGDTVTYWAEALDNDAATGGKRSASDTFVVYFPSLSEILSQAAAEQQEAFSELDEALRDQEELRGQTEEVRTADELTWERRRAAEQLIEKQGELLEDLSRTAEALQRTMDGAADEEVGLSRQIATEASRLQQLLSELDDPSLRAAMEELSKALAALEPEQVSRAAEQMTISQEELLSKLKRTVHALERLMAEQMLRAALHKALELAARQESINQRTAGQPVQDEASRRDLTEDQSRLGDEAGQLAHELAETASRISEFSPPAAEPTEQQASRVAQEVVPASRQAADAHAKGDRAEALQRGTQIHSTLSDVASSLQSTLDSMREGFGRRVARDLKSAATKLLDCSMLEEDLAQRSSGATRGSPLGQEQVGLSEVVKSVARDLESLGQETFFVNPGVLQPLAQSLSLMEQAAQHLSAGAGQRAGHQAQQAVGALNTTISGLLDAAAQAEQSGSGSGLQQALDRLASLCQRQAGLNAECEGMLSSQGQPTPSLGDMLAQLAAEQLALRAELEKAASAVEGRSHITGPLGAAGSDMERVANELREEGVTGGTVARQQSILTRMLEARNSLYRQGYRNRRLSEEAKTYTSPSPAPADEALAQPETMEMQRGRVPLEEAPPEYRDHVSAYLAAIRRGATAKEDRGGRAH
jgi:hypothetical protein